MAGIECLKFSSIMVIFVFVLTQLATGNPGHQHSRPNSEELNSINDCLFTNLTLAVRFASNGFYENMEKIFGDGSNLYLQVTFYDNLKVTYATIDAKQNFTLDYNTNAARSEGTCTLVDSSGVDTTKIKNTHHRIVLQDCGNYILCVRHFNYKSDFAVYALPSVDLSADLKCKILDEANSLGVDTDSQICDPTSCVSASPIQCGYNLY